MSKNVLEAGHEPVGYETVDASGEIVAAGAKRAGSCKPVGWSTIPRYSGGDL